MKKSGIGSVKVQVPNWMHKSGNILNRVPKPMHPKVKADLHEIWQAATREQAHQSFDLFIEKYEAKYPKAAWTLQKDREELLAFYDFPAEYWQSLRTTNPIESTFARSVIERNGQRMFHA